MGSPFFPSVWTPVFTQALQARVDELRAAGRRVFVVGDLNISPHLIDSCDPAPPEVQALALAANIQTPHIRI